MSNETQLNNALLANVTVKRFLVFLVPKLPLGNAVVEALASGPWFREAGASRTAFPSGAWGRENSLWRDGRIHLRFVIVGIAVIAVGNA